MSTKDFICKTVIKGLVANGYHTIRSDYKQRRALLYAQLAELQPDKPDDGSINMLAYNVSGKDRMKIKTGRFLTKKLNLNHGFLSDEIIHNIADTINLELFGLSDVTFELLIGPDITKAYRNAIGGSSCMTGSYNCEYTRLYEANPDRFSMLVCKFGKDSGRAIVHKLDNGSYFMDRVYYSNGIINDKMLEYAVNNGWQSRGHINDSGSLVVSNLNYTNGQIPYMDTMTCGVLTSDNKLTISYSGSDDFCLQQQGGMLEDDNSYECYNCGECYHEDSMYFANDDNYCEDCYNELFTICQCCKEPHHNDDIVFLVDANDYVCKNCAKTHYYYCDDCEKWFSNGTYLDNLGKTVCENCLDDYSKCEDCNCMIECDDITLINNGDKRVCDVCLKNYTKCADCDDHDLIDDMIHIISEDKYVCDSCSDFYERCELCGDYYNIGELVKNNEYNAICKDCNLCKLTTTV